MAAGIVALVALLLVCPATARAHVGDLDLALVRLALPGAVGWEVRFPSNERPASGIRIAYLIHPMVYRADDAWIRLALGAELLVQKGSPYGRGRLGCRIQQRRWFAGPSFTADKHEKVAAGLELGVAWAPERTWTPTTVLRAQRSILRDDVPRFGLEIGWMIRP